MSLITFTVIGDPQPAGSKRAFVNPKSGRAIVTDDNKRAKPWQAEVKAVAQDAYSGPLLRCPLGLRLIFYRPRPKAHYGSGKNAAVVKPSAPPFPTTRPDALKLARAVEDALTGVIWADDSQIVDEHLYKRYDEPARCVVEIRRLDG